MMVSTMKRSTRIIELTAFLSGLFWMCSCLNGASAHPWIEECDINFSNQFALANIYDQARTTFAVGTRLSSSGALATCDLGTSPCWVYRQRCGVPGYVNIIPIAWDHFHLSFTDPTLSCFVRGGYGRLIGGVCVAPDWTR